MNRPEPGSGRKGMDYHPQHGLSYRRPLRPRLLIPQGFGQTRWLHARYLAQWFSQGLIRLGVRVLV